MVRRSTAEAASTGIHHQPLQNRASYSSYGNGLPSVQLEPIPAKTAAGGLPVIASLSQAEIEAAKKAYKDVMRVAIEYHTALKALADRATAFASVLNRFADVAPNTDLASRIRQYANLQTLLATGLYNTACLLDNDFVGHLKANYAAHKIRIKQTTAKFKAAREHHEKMIRQLEKQTSSKASIFAHEARLRANPQAANHNISSLQDTLRELSRMATAREILKNSYFDSMVAEENRNVEFVHGCCVRALATSMETVWCKAAAHSQRALAALGAGTGAEIPPAAAAPADRISSDTRRRRESALIHPPVQAVPDLSPHDAVFASGQGPQPSLPLDTVHEGPNSPSLRIENSAHGSPAAIRSRKRSSDTENGSPDCMRRFLARQNTEYPLRHAAVPSLSPNSAASPLITSSKSDTSGSSHSSASPPAMDPLPSPSPSLHSLVSSFSGLVKDRGGVKPSASRAAPGSSMSPSGRMFSPSLAADGQPVFYGYVPGTSPPPPVPKLPTLDTFSEAEGA